MGRREEYIKTHFREVSRVTVGHIQTEVRMQCQTVCHIVSEITVPLKAENLFNN